MSGSKAFRLLVLRACRDLPPEADGFIIDRVIAEQTGVSLAEVRECLFLLEESSEVAIVRTVDGTVKALLEPTGRLALHQAFPFDGATGPERVITVKQAAAMIRAGQYREFVVQILTSPYFFALSLTIFVPILWLVLYNVYPFWQARPKPNAVVVKPTVTQSQKAEDQDPYEPYPPSPTDDEARGVLRQRLEPLKYLCKGLLNKTEKSKNELGWERVVVIESEKFSREFGAFDASTIYAKVDDGANEPLCFVFLVSERDDGVILKSLGHVPEQPQGPKGVYFKVRYQVPAVEKDDRLIIVIGLSDRSYDASVNYQAKTLDNSKKALTIAVER